MSNKNYSIILTVDLSCSRCQGKIKKILDKHQDRWNIQSVVWDEKTNKITLTGPFCPHKLARRLCRKAGKIIKDIDIPDTCECDEEKPKPKPKPADPPPPPSPAPKPETPKPAPAPSTPEASKPAPAPKSPPPPKTEPPKPVPAPAPSPPDPEPPKPAPPPPQPEPEPVAPEVDPVAPAPYPPVWPVYFCGPCCRCGWGGGYGPCNCGCDGHCGLAGDLGYGRPCLDGGSRVEFFCEEDSPCRPM